MTNKVELRESVLSQLKSLSTNEKKNIEMKLKEQVISSNYFQQASTIGITISQGFEWSTKPIIEAAWEQGKTVCVPKCYPKDKRLVFYKFTSYDELEVVYFSLKEPKPLDENKITKDNIELLVVPGVVFDKEGYRIGFGGGYYDRFLADFKNTTISIIHPLQVIKQVPKEDHDIAVQHLISTHGLMS